MSDLYRLMHKNDICGALSIDEVSGNLENFRNLGFGLSPYLGNPDTKRMKRWWESRAVPASRKGMQEIIINAGCLTSKEYLAKNLALSMTDSYWICPEDMDLQWEDVNLYHNVPLMYNGKLPYHNATSYDPNASLGGQMEKYWDTDSQVPILVKTAYKEYGQQAVNEAFATMLHQKQETTFPFAEYQARETPDNGIKCACRAFTNENVELVPALEIVDSVKTGNSISLYDAYINICSEHGVDREYMRDFMDYLTLTDFVISNTDEHLLNYGILRDASTLQFIGPAPIFDSGNSMFYADNRLKPYARHELLERKITAIHDKEEAMLKHVSNRNIVNSDLLPTPQEAGLFYRQYRLPEEKIHFITESYKRKLELLHDFQKGNTISYYLERKSFKMGKPLKASYPDDTEKLSGGRFS